MSFSKTYAAQISGLLANIIDIEVDLSNGLHAFSIVGLGDRSVEEAKDRISAAIKNSGFVSPKQRNQKVVISLAPADVKKEGTAFDVGMAVGYLSASGNIDFNAEKKLFIGELSLEGNVHRIRGILAMIRAAREKGFESAFVPKENAVEAALVAGIHIYPIDSLRELIDHISGKRRIEIQPRTKITIPSDRFSTHKNDSLIDFGSIKGQEYAKRALEVAAAGKHNVAMYGPPGTGKTMLAKAFSGILPTLSHGEVLEVTEIHSIFQSAFPENNGGGKGTVITSPPFRAPHHTSSYSAIIGGGGSPKPGEITLAHRGVLFLDEFTEFDRRTIDSLRQPIEEREITVARTKESVTYPADCIYIFAMNPCPCGGKKCICTEKELVRYRKKISGPIADRIDLWISVSKVEYEKFSESDADNSANSRSMAERVRAARAFRALREKHDGPDTIKNADKNISAFLAQSAQKMGLSARAYVRTLEVARTIADLEHSEKIKKEHVMEAIQYRQKE